MTEVPLYIKIRDIVNRHDPIHLIDIGCPVDEYDGESKRIARLLGKAPSPEWLQRPIHGIFIRMFDEKLAGPIENYNN